MVNWSDPDIKKWKEEAKIAQQDYCEVLGDREWDVIESSEWTTFRRKVGFGLFGPPQEEPSSENRQTGYNKKQREQIEKICDQLVVDLKFSSQNIHFACIFVVAKVFDKGFTDPVFRAKGENSSAYKFVDSCARVYSTWSNYLEENVLPKCLYCYPTDGIYRFIGDVVSLGFGTSPACDFVSRAGSVLDKVAAVATIGATGVGLAALCAVPIFGPIAAAATITGVTTGVYGVARSTHALYDRATHGQSVSLADSDARMCWISIVGSSLGFAHGRMLASITQAARAGDVMGKAGRIAFMVIQTGSLTVNGFGIINGLVVLIDKYENKQLTPLDVFQFSASVLFFTNSAINAKSASTIIQNVQDDIIASHRNELGKDAKKLFNKHTGQLRGKDKMTGNAKVVKQLNRIENSQQLYEMMVDKNIDNHRVRLYPDGYKGNLVVNDNLKIHPMKLVEMPPHVRQEIYTATRDFVAQTKSQTANQAEAQANFHKSMKAICREYCITFETMRKETIGKICEMYGKNAINEIQVGGRKIFANMTPHEIDRMAVVLANTCNSDADIVAMATIFAETDTVGCKSAGEYITRVEYFVADITDNAKNLENRYQRELAVAKEKPDFNLARFNKEFGIEGKRKEWIRNQVLEGFRSRDGAAYQDMARRYNDLRNTVGPLNQQCLPGFFTDDSATYHFLKHKYFGSRELTPAQYFEIAQEVTGNPTNQTKAMLTQDGSATMITYKDPVNHVMAVRIDRNYEQMSGIATVMYDSKIK